MTRTALLSFALVVLAGCAANAKKPAPASIATGEATPAETAPALRAEAAAAAEPLPPPSAEFSAAAKGLDAALRDLVAGKGLARADGYVYGLDVAAALLYAAQRGDADLYGKVLPVAQTLVVQNPDDPYTNGFVLFRMKDGAKPGRSGAQEMVWMARALWTGARTFDRPDDKALALAVLDGYAKHAYVLQGVWLARRSFDFSSRTFDNLSLLTSYQPDFLADAERGGGRGDWRGFAERSYRLLERTATPSRLLVPVIQPEVGANFPGANLDAYAPNGVTWLEDSCLGVENATAGLPHVAGGLAEFVAENAKAGGRLHAEYSSEDGSAVGDAVLPASGYACLERLAARIGNAAAIAALDPRVTAEMQAAAKSRAQLPGAGLLLLAAQARGAF